MDRETLTGLLFGFEEMADVTAETVIASMDYRPRLLPVALLPVLKKADPNQIRLTYFPCGTHIEVWLTREWKGSSSRLLLVRRKSEEESYKSNLRSYAFRRIRQAMFPDADKLTRAMAGLVNTLAQSIDKLPDDMLTSMGLIEAKKDILHYGKTQIEQTGSQ